MQEGDESMAGRRAKAGKAAKKTGAKGAKAVLAEKIREVERLWRQGDQSNWNEWETFDRAARATAEILAAAAVSLPGGGAKVFVWAPQLPLYAEAGFPLPEEIAPADAELVVVGLEVGLDLLRDLRGFWEDFCRGRVAL